MSARLPMLAGGAQQSLESRRLALALQFRQILAGGPGSR